MRKTARVQAIAFSGVDLRGCYGWIFIDNFEWAFRYSRPFGLLHCDFEIHRRTIKRSVHWYLDVIANNGFWSVSPLSR